MELISIRNIRNLMRIYGFGINFNIYICSYFRGDGMLIGKKGKNQEGKSGELKEKKMRVTRKEFERWRKKFHDANFMAQRGMWHSMGQRMRQIHEERRTGRT